MRHSRPAAGARLFIFQAADAPWVTEDEEGEEERCRDRRARGASAALQLHVCSWTCSPVTFGSCSQVWSAARKTPQVQKPPVVLSSSHFQGTLWSGNREETIIQLFLFMGCLCWVKVGRCTPQFTLVQLLFLFLQTWCNQTCSRKTSFCVKFP